MKMILSSADRRIKIVPLIPFFIIEQVTSYLMYSKSYAFMFFLIMWYNIMTRLHECGRKWECSTGHEIVQVFFLL